MIEIKFSQMRCEYHVSFPRQEHKAYFYSFSPTRNAKCKGKKSILQSIFASRLPGLP